MLMRSVVAPLAALLLACVALLLAHAVLLRASLEQQLSQQQQAAALALADALTRSTAEQRMPMLQAQVATGRVQRLAWRGADGALLFAADAPPPQPQSQAPSQSQVQAQAPSKAQAPGWFARRLSVDAPGAVAALGATAGLVEVTLPNEAATQALWASCRQAAAGLAGAALLAVLAAWRMRRAWRHALAQTATQATALAEGRLVGGDFPRWPELRSMMETLTSAIRRLREVVDTQATQVEALQRQAHTDAVSGLPNRRQFIGRLDEALADTAAPGGGLLILRILNLEALNQRLGHDSADRALAALGDLLQTYPKRVSGAFVGRLNGRDFGLYLPVAGVADETAASLLSAVRASPAGTVGGAEPVLGGVDRLCGHGASAALATADEALARAEVTGAFSVVVLQAEPDTAHAAGARAWREQIAHALADGRVQLAEHPVRDAGGELLHLACPLRVQFEPGGVFREADRWLALATRSRLLPQVDLAAVRLALQAIAHDGRPRCVRVAPVSLAAADFIDQVLRQLQARPLAAQRLWIDVTEAAFDHLSPHLHEAAAAWRLCGTRIGIDRAGGALHGLANLQPLGVSYIKVEARHVRGVATDAPVREFARSLVVLVQGMGMQVIAEDVDDPADLAALWALGFDGAAGAALGRG